MVSNGGLTAFGGGEWAAATVLAFVPVAGPFLALGTAIATNAVAAAYADERGNFDRFNAICDLA